MLVCCDVVRRSPPRPPYPVARPAAGPPEVAAAIHGQSDEQGCGGVDHNGRVKIARTAKNYRVVIHRLSFLEYAS